jgi:hypothetical protein
LSRGQSNQGKLKLAQRDVSYNTVGCITTIISALLRVEVQKRKFFVKTSTIRGISPPGRAGGRGKSKNKGRAGDEASNFPTIKTACTGKLKFLFVQNYYHTLA